MCFILALLLSFAWQYGQWGRQSSAGWQPKRCCPVSILGDFWVKAMWIRQFQAAIYIGWAGSRSWTSTAASKHHTGLLLMVSAGSHSSQNGLRTVSERSQNSLRTRHH